jgi:16S rRNA A1518/A1519 N6-dimethyltransferase RsmA/KsgA/DIM1 with predicted DNA glycosylase/AP lyase activity
MAGLFAPDPSMDQHFLYNPNKIDAVIHAAGIEACDRVAELGAGVGSVARRTPPCAVLVLVDLDTELASILRQAFPPPVVVLQEDALAVLERLDFDVIISNLPFFLTDHLLDALRSKAFRCAVVSVHKDFDFSARESQFEIEHITDLLQDDFRPQQPFVSRVFRLRHPQK